jgi:hypothetical protein
MDKFFIQRKKDKPSMIGEPADLSATPLEIFPKW